MDCLRRSTALGWVASKDVVAPAMRKLRVFIVSEYAPRAPAAGAIAAYPDSARVYEMLVRHATTTRLTAAQIHAIGLYDNPYDLFGHLQWRSLRAARLVVDTGMHSMGWSRQQAIDLMVERTGMDRGFVTSEVDRYVSIPGQALGYMVGALKIEELRDQAKGKLGAKFDLRRFHNAVIDQGALPLDVLEEVIDEWVASERAR